MTGRFSGISKWLRRNRAKAITLAVIVAVVAWFLWPEGAEPPPPPATATVVRGDIEQLIAASGTLEAGSLVDVGAQVSGQLKKLHVRLGNVVSEGDALAEIDDFIARTRLTSAEANLESLQAASSSQEASLVMARSELKRQERMMQAQATTERDYDQAVLNLAQSEANLARHLLQIEQAQASLEEARANLDFTRITAPADGTIVSIFAQEGQTLNASQTAPVILRIGDLRTINVSAKVPEADMRRLTAGMDAYFTTPADGERRWQGKLKEISPIPEGPAGAAGLAQFDAQMDVENPDAALLPGMTARVFFVVEAARDVLKLPRGAVTFAGGPMSAAGQYAQGAAGNGPGRFGGRGVRERGVRERGLRAQSPATAPVTGNGDDRGRTSPATRGREATVQVVDTEGGQQSRTIRVGVSNEVEVEVLSGLSEGERVVSGTPQPPMPETPAFFGG